MSCDSSTCSGYLAILLEGERREERRREGDTEDATTPSKFSSTVDLANQYVLPSHIVSTNIRPNTVWWNNKLQSVCMVELTVYHDTLFNEAVPQKKDKYLDLV